MSADLFDRARDAVRCSDLVHQHGGKLVRRGADWRGVCPLRGCGAKSKAEPFRVFGGDRRWKCYSCDPRGGDVVDLEHALASTGGETLADAARRLVGGDVREESDDSRRRREQARAQAEAEAMASAAWKAELAARLWREAQPAVGSPAQDYLEGRGIFGPVAARALGQLRFHPRAYHSGHPEMGVFLPAMVGLVVTEFGATGGVHCTYLSPCGRRKTHRTPAKRMWGPQGHVDAAGVLRPGGIWLTRPDAEGPLVVAEGIENALSRAILLAGDLSLPMRAAAAGSLDRLQGHEAIDDDGARDVWAPKGDPRRPPFTWPESAAAPWGLVDVATDGDMSPIKVLGRTGRGRLTTYERVSAERARVCGRLAIAGWRTRLVEGSATRVRASCPPVGRDFNDELRAKAAPAGPSSVSEAA